MDHVYQWFDKCMLLEISIGDIEPSSFIQFITELTGKLIKSARNLHMIYAKPFSTL